MSKSMSSELIQEILKLDAFKDIMQYESTTSCESQLTINNPSFCMCSKRREVDFIRHFSVEGDILKLIFTFNHIKDGSLISRNILLMPFQYYM